MTQSGWNLPKFNENHWPIIFRLVFEISGQLYANRPLDHGLLMTQLTLDSVFKIIVFLICLLEIRLKINCCCCPLTNLYFGDFVLHISWLFSFLKISRLLCALYWKSVVYCLICIGKQWSAFRLRWKSAVICPHYASNQWTFCPPYH